MDETFAGDWPAGLAWRFAAGKGRGRRPHPERLGALREVRGGPMFGGPMFGPPWARGRARRRRGDVRTAVLMLLAEEPRNGYQLMQEIEERSGGSWRPSPGSVYPLLSQLEDEGLVRVTEDKDARLFELTDAGREHLAESDIKVPPWEAAEGPGADTFRELGRLIGDVARAAGQVLHVGDEAQVRKATEILIQARRSLYRILADDEDT